MTCDPQNTITQDDLDGLNRDIQTIDDVVESSLDTTVTKNDKTINTLLGQLKLLGFIPPIPYVASIVFTTSDNTKTVDEAGVIYAPLPSALPFTTSGTFIGDDDARFFVIQGLIEGASSEFINYIAANNFAGGVTRTQEEKNADLVSDKDFGAVGDLTTDDTAAITAAAAATDTLELTSGEYRVDVDSIDVDKLAGDGFLVVGGNRVAATSDHDYTSQLLAIEAFYGFDDGTTDTQIYPGAASSPQGIAINTDGGTKRLYVMQRSAGSTWIDDERMRIAQFDYAEDGSIVNNNYFTNELSIGHQNLSVLQEGGSTFAYSAFTTVAPNTGDDAGKGYSKTNLDGGASTNQANVVNFQLFGFASSGHIFESYHGATPCVSSDGKFIILSANRDAASGTDNGKTIFVYDRSEVEAAGDPLDVMPLERFVIPAPGGDFELFVQGLACDGKFIYEQFGFTGAFDSQVVLIMSLNGAIIEEIRYDAVAGTYTHADILNNSTLGNPVAFEAEGLAIDGNDIICMSTDVWKDTGDIVTYFGKNWATTIDSNLDNSPLEANAWVETTKADTAGAWDKTTTYNTGTNYNKRGKVIFKLARASGATGEAPLSSGIIYAGSGAQVVTDSNSVDVAFRFGTQFQISPWSAALGRHFNGMVYTNQSLQLYDARDDADNDSFAAIGSNFSAGREIMELRGKQSTSLGAWINIYGGSDASNANLMLLGGGGTSSSTIGIGPLQLGFFGTTPIAKQTGVAVNDAAIHAALVNLGLISGP